MPYRLFYTTLSTTDDDLVREYELRCVASCSPARMCNAGEDALHAINDAAIAAVAHWIETTPQRFYVLDSEKRILSILADDMRHRKFRPGGAMD